MLKSTILHEMFKELYVIVYHLLNSNQLTILFVNCYALYMWHFGVGGNNHGARKSQTQSLPRNGFGGGGNPVMPPNAK